MDASVRAYGESLFKVQLTKSLLFLFSVFFNAYLLHPTFSSFITLSRFVHAKLTDSKCNTCT